MKIQKGQTALDLTKVMNKYLVIGFIAVSISCIVLAIIAFKSFGYQRTTFVPPVISQQFTLSGVAPDASYLKQMAEYELLLKLNVTPANVDRNYEQLLKYVDASSYHVIEPMLREEAKQVKSDRISANFYILSSVVAKNALVVRITGKFQKYVGSRALAPEDTTYILKFSYPNGVLTLSSFEKQLKEAK